MHVKFRRVARLLGRGARLRCPRCGAAPLFYGAFRMYENCINCDLRFEREQGYFVGAIYINYAVTAIIMIPGYFLLDHVMGLSLTSQLIVWSIFSVCFPLVFFRYARSLWLSVDYILSPDDGLDHYRRADRLNAKPH